ncbi:MAG: hypothetical protein U0V02_08645 [Anaerolineales bacterium]
MKHKRNWVIGIILSATAAFVALQNVSAPTHEDGATEAAITITASVAPSPTVIVDSSGGCGYMWAYHNDPELTAKIDEAIQQLDPSARAFAQQFGEDCVYADGHTTFSAMETDFYIQLPTEDLTLEDDFGNWVKQVMDIITALSDDSIQGKKGFVEFSFTKTDIDHIIFRVDIVDYMANVSTLAGAELFQKYYPPPTSPTP